MVSSRATLAPFPCFDLVAMRTSEKQWLTADHVFFGLVKKNAPKVGASTVPFFTLLLPFPGLKSK